MSWAHPENIIWLLFFPLFVGMAIYVSNWRQKGRKKFADDKLLPQLFPNQSVSNYWLKVVVVSVAIVLAVIALMDPLFGEEKVKVKREGIDIVYALDLSNSMYAEDVAPNRLERAKKIISNSIQNLGGDRVALIVFAADAYAISPLTNDYGAIQSYVDGASPELISQQGTNFGSVVNKAVELFENAPTTGKLLVILSDGEDNEKSAERASKIALENNIHVVTVGIGTVNGAPIPMNLGGFQEYKLDREGQTVISKLQEKNMQDLARGTSGQYIRVVQNKTAVEQLQSYLSSLDKKVQDIAFNKDKKHIFQWFLVFALLLIFIDTLTPEHALFNNKKQ